MSEIYSKQYIQSLVTTHTRHIITCNLDDLFFTNDADAQELVSNLANECNRISSNTSNVICYMVNEPYNISHWEYYVGVFKKKLGGRAFTLILNSYFANYTFSFNVIFIDFYLLRTWFESNVKKTKFGFNTVWDNESDKFLCLFGKLNKPHRIGLLYKLSLARLLKKCEWSLHIPEYINEVDLKTAIPNLSIDEINQFIAMHAHNLDSVELPGGDTPIFDYSGFPYDTKLYSTTLFRLISETFVKRDDIPTNCTKHSIPWITEKTWIPILNHQPFITVGEVGTLKLLQSKGFRTFNEYLPINNYDELLDDNDRLDACVTNTKYFFDVAIERKDTIRRDILHNVDIFKKIVKRNESVIRDVGIDVGLGDTFNIYNIIPIFR